MLRRLALLLLAWSSTAAAAVAVLRLPPGEDPAAWQGPAAHAGLSLAAGPGARVEIRVGTAGWEILATDATGQTRAARVAAPRTTEEREDVAVLAASLLRRPTIDLVDWGRAAGAPAGGTAGAPPPERSAPPPERGAAPPARSAARAPSPTNAAPATSGAPTTSGAPSAPSPAHHAPVAGPLSIPPVATPRARIPPRDAPAAFTSTHRWSSGVRHAAGDRVVTGASAGLPSRRDAVVAPSTPPPDRAADASPTEAPPEASRPPEVSSRGRPPEAARAPDTSASEPPRPTDPPPPTRLRPTPWLGASPGLAARPGLAPAATLALHGGVAVGPLHLGVVGAAETLVAVPAGGEGARVRVLDAGVEITWLPERPVTPWLAAAVGASFRRYLDVADAPVADLTVGWVAAGGGVAVTLAPPLTLTLGPTLTTDLVATEVRRAQAAEEQPTVRIGGAIDLRVRFP